MARSFALGAAILILVVAYAWGLVRVGERASSERDVAGSPVVLSELASRDSHVLVRAPLREGQAVVFEVCADDGFGPAWVDATTFEILYAEPERFDRVRSVPFDGMLAERVQRDADGVGCLVVADADRLGVAGEYVVAVAWDSLPRPLSDVRARGRVLAWTPLGLPDRVAIWLALAGAFLLIVGLTLPRRRDPLEDEVDASEPPPSGPVSGATSGAGLRVGLGVALLFGAMIALAFVPLSGARVGVLRGLSIALVEVLVAWFFVRAPRGPALGLLLPAKRPWPWLALAPVIAVVLFVLGRLVASLVPVTGVAPIELFVEYPSGRLAVALVAVFVPVAEELFFRGFVFGTVERARGANLAMLVTVVLFALVHLPQQWGAWGAFVSVALTGLVLTGLRRATGSTLLPALVHLTHNAVITLLST